MKSRNFILQELQVTFDYVWQFFFAIKLCAPCVPERVHAADVNEVRFPLRLRVGAYVLEGLFDTPNALRTVSNKDNNDDDNNNNNNNDNNNKIIIILTMIHVKTIIIIIIITILIIIIIIIVIIVIMIIMIINGKEIAVTVDHMSCSK